MLRMSIMVIILIMGMGCLLFAKMHFAKRQTTEPDNKWSPLENGIRITGYVLCVIDVMVAGFINF